MTSQLDDYTRAALCAADQPPPGVEARILGAILGSGGPPPGGSGPGGGEASGGPTLASPGAEPLTLIASKIGYAAKVVGATLGLTATGVALLAISAAGVRSLNRPEPRDEPIVQVAAPSERPTTADARPPIPETEPAVHEVEEPASTLTEPSKRSNSGSKSGPTSTLEAELALLDAARQAKDPKVALAALERHRKEFATGALASEREVLRVETLCALGRVAEAEAVAAAFLAKHPHDPLRSRVTAGCS
jgi:hypothetical protein